VIIFRDVTEQRRIEQELLRVQKLEALGLLAGGVVHDFNNLLSAIVNNVALMKTRLNSRDEIGQRLEVLEKALWRGAELTQQLLTFAKGGAPVRKPVDVASLLRETIALALAGSAIRVDEQVPNELWYADIDAGQVGHALHNLLINAKEAMPAGGMLTAAVENVVVQDEQNPALSPGPYLRLTLRDSGVGIAPENLERIFDPYFTTKERGSGLGLATVHSIVKRHDGHITAQSTPGVGTTFTLYLPATGNRASSPDGPTATAMPPVTKGRVLIMDDEELIREATGALLEHLGYRYESVRDGAEALERYRAALENNDPFDVVILDLTVPGGMGGHESLAHLREIDPKVKAIVSSGYFHDPIVANFRAHGFSGVVSKPYTIDEMSETLHQLIQFDAGDKTA
jgi:CheY-like chemotaxis protein